MHAVLLQMEYKRHTIHWLLLPFDTGNVKSREEGREIVQATLDHETVHVYDTIDEYQMASLSCRAKTMRGGALCSTPQLSHLSCEAGLLPPSMQGEGAGSTQLQKERGHQQGERRREER